MPKKRTNIITTILNQLPIYHMFVISLLLKIPKFPNLKKNGWLDGWLVGRCVSRCVGQLTVGCSVGRLVGRSVGCSVGCSVGRLVDWTVGLF